MTAEIRAADLPEGSIVEYRGVKVQLGVTYWASPQRVIYRVVDVDWALRNGAKVLRHGYGGGQP
jgi:hypothetical protein